ncbi:MAG: ArgE/DapE family deacylase [Desulfonatronovibrionaceae bacterium]
MDSREQKITAAVDELAPQIIDFTGRLAAEPSTLGNELGALGLMESELDKLSLPVRRIPIDYDTLSEHPGYAPAPWAEPGRYCLVSELPGTSDKGRSLIFNGHLDVVAADPKQWDTDPFIPQRRQNRMFGRGTGDMKAGVAAMLYAAYAVRRAGFHLRGPLTLEAVIEEECSGNGALACRAAGIDADAVLIPEPFGPKLYTAQVGVCWFKVSVSGRPVHVQEAGAGANALEKCFPLIQALREMEKEMNAAPLPGPYSDLKHPLNLNIGMLFGGDWPSTVAAEAEFHGRMSYPPQMDFARMKDVIENAVKTAADQDPWLKENPPRVEFYGFRSDGHIQSRDVEQLQILDECHQEFFPAPAEEYASTCTTDLRAFYSFGRARGCCYGPVAENIHGVNECVKLDSILHTARVYALFAARWCGLEE